MTYSIEVENINCGGCMSSIKTALLKSEGVQEVTIDKDKETVSISTTVQREALVNTLASLGFPEKEKNNLLHKAKSYVSCAVGNLSS